ncbi:phage tail fiber assembly protein [Cupriavidus taiwanensis]|uniref:tail fiber assembly protein n=1 Tax=Cupriavidus taiwanensis TaxID=164546 RepID=UPI000E15BCFF|nr:tail fiber assembly protein [Cupriavidus taiwanensis]SPA24030.1 phage tail fiber assembly protein [Cupriavidus taiwanensis]
MMIHHYDSHTGQYICSALADPDPRNPNAWLQPAFTTLVPLPERNRYEWPFFRDDAWVMLPDYRGVILYRTESGEPAELGVPGVTPQEAGLTPDPRPSELHRWTAEGWTLDAALVAERTRAAAMAEFDRLMAIAREANAGKADAYAAGLLDAVGTALFKAWSAYQLDLVRVVNSTDFPVVADWPEAPNVEAITAAIEAEEAAKAAARAEYDALVALANEATAGKAEAYAAGQLDAVQKAIYEAWLSFLLQLQHVALAPTFPLGVTWPTQPDEAAIEAGVHAKDGAASAAEGS